jgi:hypothetical protein
MRKTVVVVLLAFVFGMGTWGYRPAPAMAGDDAARSIFMDTFYGMAAGALIGSAVSLAQDSADWGGNIGSGAAIGGIAGALFGIFTEVSYMVEIQDGKVAAGIPRVDVIQRNTLKAPDVVASTGLFRYRF